MSNISKVIPGFHNGVSQQSATMRLDSQVEGAENCLGSLVEGTIKRPNTDFIATLTSLADGDVFVHAIERDASEKYFVILTGDESVPIEVFTIDGTPCSVAYGTLDDAFTFTADATVKQYLNMASGKAKNNFRAVTIADHTFIVNRLVSTDMSSAASHNGGAIEGSVQIFSKLTDVNDPTEGDVWEVTGNDTNHFDNYYVEFQGGTLWLETIAPNIEYALEASLMPHRLVRTALNTFVFAPIEWGERTAGDEASAPNPSFIGNPITSIFFFRNRLGFLSGDNIVLSAAGDYYRLYPKTALDVLDDDPIDLAASLKEVSTLYSVAGFNKNLLILGSPQQFSLGAGDNSMLTPATATLDGTTRFTIQENCEPVAMGSAVYFANPRQQHVAIREYLIQENTLMEDAADITAHCPSYIPMGDITLAGITSMDMLFVHSSGDPAALYVYKFYWNGNEKAQSAWHRWTFDDNILSLTTLNESLYIIFDGNETKLERIDVESLSDGDLDFRCHLDHKVAMEGRWTGEVTVFKLPYTPKMENLIAGGIDEHAILMLQSDSPPYIGAPTAGNDENTLLLIHSNQSSGLTFTDSSEYERTLTMAQPSDINLIHADPYHSIVQKKFGISSICFPHVPVATHIRYPMAGTPAIDFSEDFTIDCWLYLKNYLYNNTDDDPWDVYGDSFWAFTLVSWGSTDGYHYFRCGIGGAQTDNKLFIGIGKDATDIPSSAFSALDGNEAGSRTAAYKADALGAFPLNRWVHVALERNQDHLSVYRDGRKVIGMDWPGLIADVKSLGMGDPGFGRQWTTPTSDDVWFDEYRVSNIARYGGKFISEGAYWFVPEDYAYGETPYVYVRTLADSSDYQHPAVFLNNAYHKNDQGWPVRFPRTSFYFDGVDGAIEVPHSDVFNFTTTDFTLDWQMYLQSADEATLFAKWDTNEWGWQVKWNGAGISFEWSYTGLNGGVGSVAWTFDLNLSTWYHIAIVRNGGGMALYVNGRSKGNYLFAGTVLASTAPLRIGFGPTDLYPLDGALEEIRFSDIARWTSNFLPPLAAYDRSPGGWYDGVGGGIPDGFDPNTMAESFGLHYLASYFGMDIVHPVSGLSYPEATIWGDEIYVRENLTGYTMIIGKNYMMALTLTPIYMTNQQGRAILDGRLQLRNFTVAYKDTGYFNFAVAPIGRSVLLHTFTGADVGSSLTDKATIATGERRFPVLSKASNTTLQITNETYLPSKIQSASYEATFSQRSRTV